MAALGRIGLRAFLVGSWRSRSLRGVGRPWRGWSCGGQGAPSHWCEKTSNISRYSTNGGILRAPQHVT